MDYRNTEIFIGHFGFTYHCERAVIQFRAEAHLICKAWTCFHIQNILLENKARLPWRSRYFRQPGVPPSVEHIMAAPVELRSVLAPQYSIPGETCVKYTWISPSLFLWLNFKIQEMQSMLVFGNKISIFIIRFGRIFHKTKNKEFFHLNFICLNIKNPTCS